MADSPKSRTQNGEIVIHMSPWGDFFVWIANHVELLRRKHRIVGHLSFGVNGPSGNITHSVCLPLILSVEETVFLLYHEIAILQSVQPVRNLNPVSPRSLARYDQMLNQHYQESVEIFRRQKRQRTLCHYSEILEGQVKREERQAAKSRGCLSRSTVSGESAKRQPPKLSCPKRQKTASSVETSSDYEFVAEENLQNKESTVRCCLPTLEELTSTPAAEEIARLVKYIHLHRPRPTPKEWVREQEYLSLPVPLTARGNIVKIAQWLLEASSKSHPERDEATIIRCRVFNDLWSRGFYVTCSAAKMGGDFLVYQGDPLIYHASHIVITSSPQAPIYLSHLAASLRIANSVRKALVIATVTEPNGTECSQDETKKNIAVVYTSLYWMGSRIPSKIV